MNRARYLRTVLSALPAVVSLGCVGTAASSRSGAAPFQAAAAPDRSLSLDPSLRAAPAAGSLAITALITPPAGVKIEMACVPSGPELCFNATDDNCNGVIEEGCGVASGLVHFAVAWGDSPADLDLAVIAPAGDRVSEANRTSSSGLRLDRDCPRDACLGQNAENITLEGLDPPRGAYLVEIKLSDLHGATSPVRARFGARIGSRTYGAELALTPEDDRKMFRFEL